MSGPAYTGASLQCAETGLAMRYRIWRLIGFTMLVCNRLSVFPGAPNEIDFAVCNHPDIDRFRGG